MRRAYEHPTLMLVGSFRRVTGVKRKASPDFLGQHSLVR
ncbi:keywimysin-related RiPP [Streptomyces iconiensis]|uniref:Keywimysin-related RiPP n=1 Tax=Streptomyces iconiensis TaxID=1384038 RepID=A0ABT7A7E2_9ACTN|nr:keywimysin-related RiPP [Streptomyces iconiensis]MDJ1136929.1 keywimysin-related RiPP [Streptomyces iconiensis]